jgi:hypothetical protein
LCEFSFASIHAYKMKNCLCIRLILIHNSLHTKRSSLISLRRLQIIENFGCSCGLGAQHSLIKESNWCRDSNLSPKHRRECSQTACANASRFRSLLCNVLCGTIQCWLATNTSIGPNVLLLLLLTLNVKWA